jgi:hypothetical protein
MAFATVHKEHERGHVARVEQRVVLGTKKQVTETLEQATAAETVNTSYGERYHGTQRHFNARKTRKVYPGFSRWLYRFGMALTPNAVLERKIAHLLRRPVGRPSHKPKKFYASFRYRTGSWDQPRRVVVKVEWHAGELFPRVDFIVTNLKWDSKRVGRFYNRRGMAEQWIKEGKNTVKWTKLSCRRFKDNAARLQLFGLAYNLANFLRQLVLPKPIQGWTLTTLWARVQPLLPPPPQRRFRFPGRKPLDYRKILTGILFVLKTGIAWDDLPADLGCGWRSRASPACCKPTTALAWATGALSGNAARNRATRF